MSARSASEAIIIREFGVLLNRKLAGVIEVLRKSARPARVC
jgi:hypothetical protein